MNIDFNKLGQFLLNLVKLPPLRLVIAILLIINGIQFYEKQIRSKREDEKLQKLSMRLDSCKLQNYRDERWWVMRLDSVRVEMNKKYEDKLVEINKKSEEALEEQRKVNEIMEKTISNLSKHR